MVDTTLAARDSISHGSSEFAVLLSHIRKWLLIAAGTICVGLGIAGIFLPLLPTTPFLLLAAVCYAGSSKRFYLWLTENRWFGRYIKNYRDGKGLTLTTKVVSLVSLWVTIGYSAIFVVPPLMGKLALLAIAAGVSIHILSKPTCKS
jgi:uncharacterized membrane protein YbaN (DUF454 family)